MTKLFQHYVDPKFPHIAQIAGETSIFFVNVDEFLEPQRPITSRVVFIGGVGLRRNPGRLSDALLAFIEPSAGFVFFSLGSNVGTTHIARSTKIAILDAFARFREYRFIVKVDVGDDEFRELGAAHAENVRIVSWVAQGALLGECRVKWQWRRRRRLQTSKQLTFFVLQHIRKLDFSSHKPARAASSTRL